MAVAFTVYRLTLVSFEFIFSFREADIRGKLQSLVWPARELSMELLAPQISLIREMRGRDRDETSDF